ncbi:hypothetical protein CPB84DRAFT_1853558 [Gymnopilus junonius]|uniref:Protein kinase domain-containing protein n=1 Tax=Gymnopilus junonius TaxID=109634 RepID=A0A9P5TGV1_GYMJU|nr:hypothetical protein CPB84DRAFT_1853558 [Gymnopilus junonius]
MAATEASTEHTAQDQRPSRPLLERANKILSTTTDVSEDNVESVVQELLKGYGSTASSGLKLRRSLAWTLYARPDVPAVASYEGQNVAVKVLKQYALDTDINHLWDFLREAQDWKKLNGKSNITPLHGCFSTVDLENQNLTFAFGSTLANSTLQQHLIDESPPSVILQCILDVAKGLQVAHESDVIHGDIALVSLKLS